MRTSFLGPISPNILPWSRLGFVALAALSLICSISESKAADDENKIKIGALLSLTGDWSSLGIASKACMEIAVQEINQELISDGSKTRVQLIIEDTKLDPTIALEKFKSLTSQGVSVIVGPQSSAELRAIEPLAVSKKVIVISQGSTASSLAIADDAVFRFCPTDVHEGEAIAALMQESGIKVVIPIWRGDAGNDGLESSTASFFTASGGKFLPGIRYPADATNFKPLVDQLAAKVKAAVAKYGQKSVAVYLASFDEGIDILALSNGNSDLAVRWFGGDGLTQSQALLANKKAYQFAKAIGFTSPSLGLDPAAAAQQENLFKAVFARIGYEPDAFAAAAYDATYVGYLARNAVPKEKAIGALQAAFARAANRYWGASGATTLDAAGDRAVGNYDFFTVSPSGWTFTSSYP